MGKVTISRVAEHAKTSISTVSRVLSNPDYPVAAETRIRVLQAADRLGYKMNTLSRNSCKTSFSDIGVIVPNISNPFYSIAIASIEKECRKKERNIILCNSYRDPQQERMILQSLYQNGTKGVIMSTMEPNEEYIKEFSDKGMQLILLDQRLKGFELNHIYFDYQDGAQEAVDYLYEMGHSRICFASTPLTRWSRQEIHAGFRNAITKRGFHCTDDMIFKTEEEFEEDEENIYEFESGQFLAREFLDCGKKYTAVLCVNDMVAIGFIKELNAHGVSVPYDVSVIGYDDLPMAKMSAPTLTTMRCPAAETGRLAARLIMQRLNGEFSIGFGIKLESMLIKRDSVQAI